MSEYQRLIAEHQALQRQLADQPDTVEVEDVLHFIGQVRDAGEHIGDPGRREQMRAILKHWGAFVYEDREEYPATQLPPYRPRAEGEQERRRPKPRAARWWAIRVGGGAIGLLLLAILVVAISRGCGSPAVVPTEPPTWTPSPTPQSVATTIPSSPPKPKNTKPPTPSPTPTDAPTHTCSPTPSSTPTRTPSPTPSPDSFATAIQGSSIFAMTDANSQVLGSVRQGEQVWVLGRSAFGQWFYVRDDQSAEGFVYAPRFEWAGDYESLPVIASGTIAPPPTKTAAPPPTNTAAPPPTKTAEPTQSYPPPELLGINIVGCDATFYWTWTGALARGEYFAVRVGSGAPGHSRIWTKQTQATYRLIEADEYAWEVAICRGEPETSICEQLAVSEQESFSFRGCQ